jgi:hypothetical protein
MSLHPVTGNLDASAHSGCIVPLDVVHEARQRIGPSFAEAESE